MLNNTFRLRYIILVGKPTNLILPIIMILVKNYKGDFQMNLKYTHDLINQLEKGIFLTVKNKEKVNTMTIGWGSIGILWGKPVFIIPVRFSRYTYELMMNTNEFTISVPLNNNMNHAITYAGTKSGRDVNKIDALNLNILSSKYLDTPIIKECQLHYECKIIYKQTLEPNLLEDNIKETKYPNHNYHVLFYGEIIAEYKL